MVETGSGPLQQDKRKQNGSGEIISNRTTLTKFLQLILQFLIHGFGFLRIVWILHGLKNMDVKMLTRYLSRRILGRISRPFNVKVSKLACLSQLFNKHEIIFRKL